jgi:hypothetical protein
MNKSSLLENLYKVGFHGFDDFRSLDEFAPYVKPGKRSTFVQYEKNAPSSQHPGKNIV